MIKLLTGYGDYSDDDLVHLGEDVATNLPTRPVFATLKPTPAEITEAVDALSDAIRMTGPGRAQAIDMAHKKLATLLAEVATNSPQIAGVNDADLGAIGLPTAKVPTRVTTPPDAPQNLRLSHGAQQGEILGRIDAAGRVSGRRCRAAGVVRQTPFGFAANDLPKRNRDGARLVDAQGGADASHRPSRARPNLSLELKTSRLMHARYARDGLPLRVRMLSDVDSLGRLGCLLPSLANAMLKFSPLRAVMEKTLGISRRRSLPHYGHQRFDKWFVRQERKSNGGRRGRLILWDDTFVRYHKPHIGIAAVAVLEALGFEVELVGNRKCCGRPAFS